MITCQREAGSVLAEEIAPMLQANYRETGLFKDIPLEINQQAYARLEQAGALRCYTARDGKALVGYAIFFVMPSLRHPIIQASHDVLYVSPEYRGTRVAYRLVRFCDGQLEAEGVQVVYQVEKASMPYGDLLESLGYCLVDRVYAKRLKGPDHG